MIPAEFSADILGQWVGQHLWPLFRLGSFLMVVPIFGSQLVPARIRLGLALLMTILIVPLLPDVPRVEALSADAVMITLQQVLIGVGMGFAVTALWQLFVVAGQMIAMQMEWCQCAGTVPDLYHYHYPAVSGHERPSGDD